ncbi:MAG TPA: enoyl-CoA hydratase/isomerase family protein [Syntrophales bacterium]|nr:enoyl-CoA hydratase/isomerase family protein [Syntrophales bacterium]HPX82381.1 enoyl-CoA hydratase/isomerase family protein [Syntrophales bacterium]HQB13382.1 enoyl-CoA hydratase/isomerase family protein [Syntrophales bacterium]HQK80264.1 enoyl-CoA hydratase/isomerase family protein [Syntrophales bacterium]
MPFETILTDLNNEGLAILTLNRPDKRNAVSIQMRREISSCLKAWKADPAVRVLVLTGAGNAFTAGFDLSEFKKPALIHDLYQTSSAYHRDIWYFPKPTIAAVNGPALAGGFDLVKLCDIRICSPEACFGHPEIKFGSPTLFTPLKWLIGAGLARELCLSGRIIDGAEAYRIGLVNELVAVDRLLARAREIAGKIMAAPQLALEKTKRFFLDNSDRGFEESFSIEHDKGFQEFLLKIAAEALQ